MSLQVWLPLNGNLDNKGLSDPEFVYSSIAYNDNGKIGKCLNRGTIQANKNYLGYEGTIAFWIYINPDVNNTGMLYGNDIVDAVSSNRKWSLFLYPNKNSIHSWGCMKDDSYATNGDFTISNVLPDGKWTHVCIAHDRSKQYIYINGELKSTVSWNSNGTFTFDTATYFMTDLDGNKINDYRLYDHCLSAKEVKQISQGLVCHYPLKSQYETGQVNKYSGDVAEGSLNIDSAFTKTKLEGERGYNYKFSYTGNGNDRWDSMDAGYFSFTIGKRYYYSCKVRCHSKNFNMQLRASRSSNDWVTNMTNVLYPDGEWHEYVVYQTINSTYDRSGSTITCNPILEFYTDDLVTSGKVYSADFDIKDVQVIESDCYVPFIDNDMVSNVVSDCSGYGNNGTKVGNIAWSGDSARYNGSYKWPQQTSPSSKIISPIIPLDGKNFTASVWIKLTGTTAGGSGYHIPFASASLGYYEMSIDTSGRLRAGIYINGTRYVEDCSNPSMYDEKWHHIAITYDGTKICRYVDGVAYIQTNITGTADGLSESFYLGQWGSNTYYFNNNIYESDLRIYATALSADDIKELYNTAASIDKTGVLSAYEFVEEG